LLFTFTFKQALPKEAGFISGNQYDYNRNLRWFFNRLNRMLYGQLKAKGPRIPAITVLERSEWNRWHSHLMIDMPEGSAFEEMRAAIQVCWFQTPWAYNQFDIQPDGGPKWTNYMLKWSTKPGAYGDFILWENCFLNVRVPVSPAFHQRLEKARRNHATTEDAIARQPFDRFANERELVADPSGTIMTHRITRPDTFSLRGR
jgi:hypothetical protein